MTVLASFFLDSKGSIYQVRERHLYHQNEIKFLWLLQFLLTTDHIIARERWLYVSSCFPFLIVFNYLASFSHTGCLPTKLTGSIMWLLNGYLRLKKHFFWSRIAIHLCRHNNLWRVRLVLRYLWQEFTIFPNLGRCHHIAINVFETLEYKQLFWSLLEREFVIFPYKVHIQIYIDKIYYDKISFSLGLYVAIV